MSSLEIALREATSGGRKAFVPYLTAGIPSAQRFVDLIALLAGSAAAVEVGIPFSDPIMDGPIIQEASARALAAGVTPRNCFAMIRESLRHADVPIVVMTYYNPVHRMGVDKFVNAAAAAGVKGLIVPDLPFDESKELSGLADERDIALIQMVSPATSPERTAKIAKASAAFVYAVSRMGVTGEQDDLAATARAVVDKVRPHTSLPILLGIGISSGTQARAAAGSADGVIVGSALMKRVLAGDVDGAATLAKEIAAALA